MQSLVMKTLYCKKRKNRNIFCVMIIWLGNVRICHLKNITNTFLLREALQKILLMGIQKIIVARLNITFIFNPGYNWHGPPTDMIKCMDGYKFIEKLLLFKDQSDILGL